MIFTPTPLFDGDMFLAARKLAQDAVQEISRLPDPAARADSGDVWWGRIVELGWPILCLPEIAGGAGGSLDDLLAIVEGAATGGLPLPVARACGVLPALLAAADPTRIATLQQGRLSPLIDGGFAAPSVSAALSGRHVHLHGRMEGEEIVPGATDFVLACRLADAPALLLLPEASLHGRLRRYERIDGRLTADIDLEGIVVEEGSILAHGETVARCVASALDLGTLLSGVEIVSALGAALHETIRYLADRQQFGVPLSSFQALRHQVAEVFITYETLRGLVQHVLREVRQDATSARDIHLMKMHLGPAARRAAETIIQLHGGMGMTQELPATVFNKRLLMAEFESGDMAWHAALARRAA